MQESGNSLRLWHHVSRVTLHVSLCLVLSGCGFQLRDSYKVPEFMQQLTLRNSSGSHEFGREIRLALERRNILPDGGELVLDITREQLTRQTSSVDSHAKAAEYTLVYTVEYRVGTVDGKVYGDRQSLILRRSYQYSNTNVVGKNTEEETLLHELRVDAARQIVRQISTLKAMPSAPAGAEGVHSQAGGNADPQSISPQQDAAGTAPATRPQS